jgi:hypothetical protein
VCGARLDANALDERRRELGGIDIVHVPAGIFRLVRPSYRETRLA